MLKSLSQREQVGILDSCHGITFDDLGYYYPITQLDWDKACEIIKEKGWHLLKKEGVNDKYHGNLTIYYMVKDINAFEDRTIIF